MCGISVLEFLSIFIIRFFVKREEAREETQEDNQFSDTQPKTTFKLGEV